MKLKLNKILISLMNLEIKRRTLILINFVFFFCIYLNLKNSDFFNNNFLYSLYYIYFLNFVYNILFIKILPYCHILSSILI